MRHSSRMPSGHMRGMRWQVCTGLVEPVVEIEIEMVRLQVHHREDGRHSGRELAECLKYILSLMCDTSPESLIVDLGP